MSINKEILKYYESGMETNRLSLDMYQIEKIRTQEIIQRYIKKTPVKILDVGGGTGFYSFWLSEMGHEAHLVDPVPQYIKEAESYSHMKENPPASVTVGEARKLNFIDNYFDIVLLLGPLYHLMKKEHRIRALQEARRVMITDGTLLCAGISRYTSMFDGYFRNFV